MGAGPHNFSDLARGREFYARRAWQSAHETLSRADRARPLVGEDLERLAMSAYLIGRDVEYLELLQRAYHAHLAAGASASAARTAFWLGLRLLFRGEVGHANGWLGRAQRLLEREERECVEHGYLLLATTQRHIGDGDFSAAYEAAASAATIGERFVEADVVATARHLMGRIRLQQGKVPEGLSLLDEAMVFVSGGELSPLVTGLIYCSVIEGYQEVYAFERAREWTSALSAWCAEQPEMVAFTGVCSVHRAEILQLGGAWSEALAQAERAAARCLDKDRLVAAAAYYQQGEVRRLRGEFDAAEEAYHSASQWGYEPQPGLSLLRLAQDRTALAAASIRRALAATSDRSRRARLLPAYIEVMLAHGEIDDARSASRELAELAEHFDSAVLRALAMQAQGANLLDAGDAAAAVEVLRRAGKRWQEIGAPHLAARVRMLVGQSCRTLGDEEGAKLEISAARKAFEELGARADLTEIDAIGSRRTPSPRHGLTLRELQVLRLVASGQTNRAIAGALSLSEKTVERHISNIFTKLDVPSRTAATAYAYEQGLIRADEGKHPRR